MKKCNYASAKMRKKVSEIRTRHKSRYTALTSLNIGTNEVHVWYQKIGMLLCNKNIPSNINKQDTRGCVPELVGCGLLTIISIVSSEETPKGTEDDFSTVHFMTLSWIKARSQNSHMNVYNDAVGSAGC